MTVVVLYETRVGVCELNLCRNIHISTAFLCPKGLIFTSVGINSCRGWKDPVMMPYRCLNHVFIWYLCSRLFTKLSCSRFLDDRVRKSKQVSL